MARKGVAAKDVFKAAEALAAEGQTPTQGRIRAYLGRGSRGTLHKYLKQWKHSCFQKGVSTSDSETMSGHLLAEKQALEKTVEKQISEHTLLTAELIEKERAFIKIQEKNQILTEALRSLKVKYEILEITHQSLQDAYRVLQGSQEQALQKVMADKNQQIESLRQELKEVNELSLATVREIGYQSDDALMMEKVKIIHLTDEVNALKKTISDLKKQLWSTQYGSAKISERDTEKTEKIKSNIVDEY